MQISTVFFARSRLPTEIPHRNVSFWLLVKGAEAAKLITFWPRGRGLEKYKISGGTKPQRQRVKGQRQMSRQHFN